MEAVEKKRMRVVATLRLEAELQQQAAECRRDVAAAVSIVSPGATHADASADVLAGLRNLDGAMTAHATTYGASDEPWVPVLHALAAQRMVWVERLSLTSPAGFWPLRDDGAACLSWVVRSGAVPRLQACSVADNGIGVDGAMALVRAMRQVAEGHGLECTLDLRRNAVENVASEAEESIKALRDAIATARVRVLVLL